MNRRDTPVVRHGGDIDSVHHPLTALSYHHACWLRIRFLPFVMASRACNTAGILMFWNYNFALSK